VRAGLDIVAAIGQLDPPAAIGKLQVRIGIATGLVVVGDLIGEGEAQERGVVGETPNLAARLQALAEPGTVVVPAATRRLIGDLFRLRGLGRHAVKGLAEPVEAWAVEGVSASEGRFEAVRGSRLTAFVGRELELGLLLERWKLAQDGEGQVVLLSGEPGIGKSRILRELRERLEADHATRLRFHCSPYYVNSAFYPVIDNYERALRFALDETPERKLDKLEALLVGEYSRPREDVRFIATMLSIPCEERYGAVAMTPQKFKDETLRALGDTTEAIARRRPAVMLFEDIHWADPTTLETLDLLIHRVGNIPLLIVLTHRPEFVSRWPHYGHLTTLTLSKLTRSQSRAMVARLSGGKPLPADLLDQILAKTDGVPLFVEELTKSSLESPDLKDAGDHWEYAERAGALAIPLTLRDSLMARLDRFAPVREVAQIGAAIGREFSWELIAAVAPHPRPELDQALVQLVESGLAFQQGMPPDAVYTFKHALVQDAAYDSLLRARRQELHGKIATAIEERWPQIADTEPELLAHHYTEAKLADKAVPLWRTAGSLALKRMALVEAIAHLNKGLELVAALPSAKRDNSELDLRILLGTAWMGLKGWPAQEVWDNLHPALALAHSRRRNDAFVPILWGLRAHVTTSGRIAESLGWVTQLMNAAETYRDPDLMMLGHTAAAVAHFWFGEPLKVREHADRVLALYPEERHGPLVGSLNTDPKTESLVYSALSTWMLGYPEQALRFLDATHDHARRRGHPFDLGWVLSFGGHVFDYIGEPDEWLKRIEEADRVGRENSLPLVTEHLVPAFSGIALIRKGEIAEGMASLARGLAVWEQSGGRLGSPCWKSVLTEGMARIGDLAGALVLIDEIIAQIERPGWEERQYYAEALRIKGWLLSLEGDPERAERSYLASLDWARQQQAKSWELRTATSYARLMRDQGRVREAYDLLAPVYAWFTEGFATKDLKDAKALLEELADAQALLASEGLAAEGVNAYRS
jgi:hypothetical protein